ncbi:MAG: UDP-2,3-diacylglucosamine diphosphatase [Rikenella sp.]|nr:UDP-2,3-diacylglucosamine diphosphatase [Rikenella sp.]
MAYYFASDIHLGLVYNGADPRERERLFVSWLNAIQGDCEGLFLVGDLFDFWFEYRYVVPKGFVRTLGKLAELCDRGIPVHFFVGNHDLWIGDSFAREIGMIVHTRPALFELNGRTVWVAHGDGLGKSGDWRYALLRRIFHSRFLRRIFSALLHPNLMIRFGRWWSSHNRHGRKEGVAHRFRGEEEPIVQFARTYVAAHPETAYLVCGHMHTPVVYPLGGRSSVAILGEWIEHPVYGRLSDAGELELIEWPIMAAAGGNRSENV